MSGPPDFGDLGVPSVDVCAICSDSECDGVGCICGLDPNDESDIPRLERLQSLVRWGQAWEQANQLIAYAEGRWPLVNPTRGRASDERHT